MPSPERCREAGAPRWRASLAAATAYGSLVFTDFRGFNQFGWIGGFGMVVCWVANMLVIPPLLSLFGEKMVPVSQAVRSHAGSTPDGMARPRGPVRFWP